MIETHSCFELMSEKHEHDVDERFIFVKDLKETIIEWMLDEKTNCSVLSYHNLLGRLSLLGSVDEQEKVKEAKA